jgi:uncharacterized protein
VRNLLATVVLFAAWAGSACAQAPTPRVPVPQGFVTDNAGVIDAATKAKMTRLLEELQQKTGAEIAVLTVDSTAPLDDFTYAMQVADAWKPGKKRDDTGVLVLLAVQDRKVRVLVGYGLEGILPDGLVGAIQDQEMVPEFRAGRLGDGLWRGVAAIANRIATDRGVTLTGVPAPRRVQRTQPQIPFWAIVLIVLFLMFIASRASGGPKGLQRRRGPLIVPGGGGFGGGGFGGGGGGFGGFGGGGFGGGGAGRSW